VPFADFPELGVRGPEAAWYLYLEYFEAFERVPVEDIELVDAGGDKVLAHQRYDLRRRRSGAEVEFDYWIAVTVPDRRILRAGSSADRAEALAAVGLRGKADRHDRSLGGYLLSRPTTPIRCPGQATVFAQ
jgi:ketosteroid isomerase-like protein